MPGNTIKKVCLYKNCGAKNCTLFRFPKETERFAVWVENSGLEIKGNVDINKPRFLCDKHFSNNYVSFQSRRKMLVHTAVPMHHNGTHSLIPSSQSNSFNIVEVGETSPQLNSKPDKIEIEQAVNSINGKNNNSTAARIPVMRPKINRHSILVKRESNRIVHRVAEDLIQQEPDAITITMDKEDQEPLVENSTKLLFENDEENISLEAEDLDEFLPCIKRALEDSSPTNSAPAKKRKVKIIYVKKKRPEVIEETVIDVDKNDEKTIVCIEDDVKPSSEKPKLLNNSEAVELKPMFQHGLSMSNRSEFIFSGEMYIQMSKRNYEAEKTKLQNEIDHYKALLRKLKDQVLAINID
ncbi:unnamed protein product [Diamesa tonsa]